MKKKGIAIVIILVSFIVTILGEKMISNHHPITPVEIQDEKINQNPQTIESENITETNNSDAFLTGSDRLNANVGENINETNNLDAYYGCYQITQFYPTIYYRNRKYEWLLLGTL